MRRPKKSTIRTDIYEIRPRADKHGVDLVSDALPPYGIVAQNQSETQSTTPSFTAAHMVLCSPSWTRKAILNERFRLTKQIESCDVSRDARPSSKQVASRGKETRPPNLILRKR
jgi:hypothetical protein